jgi:hypothetical protein
MLPEYKSYGSYVDGVPLGWSCFDTLLACMGGVAYGGSHRSCSRNEMFVKTLRSFLCVSSLSIICLSR